MKYLDMVIEASDLSTPEQRNDTHWWRSFKVRVLSSPAGEMAPDEAVPLEYDASHLKDQLSMLDERELDWAGLLGLGQLLGSLLLPDESSIRELFLRSLDLIGQDTGLRLRLRLPPDLSSLPWEYVYAIRSGTPAGMTGFISLNPQLSIVRHEVLRAPIRSMRIVGDIRVLAALSSPKASDLEDINLEQEEAHLRKELEKRDGIKAEFLVKAKLTDVNASIPGVSVFHFAGHGTYRQQSGPLPHTTKGRGELVLEDQRVDAERLAINLHHNGVRLVVLNSCETGRGDGINVWGGIASALVHSEIPAVVANQYKILHKCATEFSRQFYSALIGGLPVERAVSAGRIAAYNADPDGRDWGVPVLYLRGEDGELFEGAIDANVRENARKAVEQLVVQQSLKVVQQKVEFGQQNIKFGNMTVNLGSSAPPEIRPSTARLEDSPVPPSVVEVASADSSQSDWPSEKASSAQTETQKTQARLQLASEALRPVFLRLISESQQDDLPLGMQCVFDLSYELARDRRADAVVIDSLVENIVGLVPGIAAELEEVLRSDKFADLTPVAALSDASRTQRVSGGTWSKGLDPRD